MKKMLEKNPILTASQLKMRIPELDGVSMRTNQRNTRTL
jgi:hypothetical protein